MLEVRVPALGEAIVSVRVGRWHQSEGAVVRAGEPLVELLTDKADVELAAPSDGVVRAVHAASGETMAIGALLATLEPLP